MKVEVRQKVGSRSLRIYFADWKYANPDLEKILKKKEITQEEANKLKGKKLMEKLEMKSLPTPTITTCVLRDGRKRILKEVTIKKHKDDPYNKNKARSYSLGKALKSQFPDRENKEIRKKFWDTYLSLKQKK